MYSVLRPLLFRLDPEFSHRLTLYALRFTGLLPPLAWVLSRVYDSPPKPVTAFGLTFKNPVGLAAGYDKDGRALRGLAALGFGHLEIGTVTPRPQPGNPRPRLFRLPEDEAIINRLGFPSQGAERVIQNLSSHRRSTFDVRPLSSNLQPPTLIGVNLGKNKDTSVEEAADDYLSLMYRFAAIANYLTLNISSPNTEGLQRLQGRQLLESLLKAVRHGRETIASGQAGSAPVLVKLSPDLTDAELDDAVGVALDQGMHGLIVTNTTRAREELRSPHRREAGGLSGAPLRVRSEALLRQTVKYVNGRVPVVSAGGIMSPEDAQRRLDLGASLIQIYTGLVYRGPSLVNAIVRLL